MFKQKYIDRHETFICIQYIENKKIAHNKIHCVQKKHPLTFTFMSPSVMRRFKQKLQRIYLRNSSFSQCKN